MNTFNRSLVSKEVAVTPKGVIPTIPLSVSAFCQVREGSITQQARNPGEMLTRQRAVCNIVTALLYNGTDYRFSSNLRASTCGRVGSLPTIGRCLLLFPARKGAATVKRCSCVPCIHTHTHTHTDTHTLTHSLTHTHTHTHTGVPVAGILVHANAHRLCGRWHCV